MLANREIVPLKIFFCIWYLIYNVQPLLKYNSFDINYFNSVRECTVFIILNSQFAILNHWWWVGGGGGVKFGMGVLLLSPTEGKLDGTPTHLLTR